MNVETVIKREVKPVRIEVIGKKLAFRLVQNEEYPIYIMDSWDDSNYYAINTLDFTVATLRSDVMVYPVPVKSIRVEIEL